MKYIKLFEAFVKESRHTPVSLDSLDQVSITTEFTDYQRYLETDSFIFFTNGEEDTLMYRKSNLELVSDNYMAQNYLFELQCGSNDDGEQIIWASEEAQYNIECQREEDGNSEPGIDTED